MSDFISRLNAEKDELETKIFKLRDFLDGGRPEHITELHWDLLHIQLDAMWTYWRCLETRLKDLGEKS